MPGSLATGTVVIIAGIALAAHAEALPVTVRGYLTDEIHDGDSFALGQWEVRLRGIQAPDRGEPGYLEAAQALREIINGSQITCTRVDVDRYGRLVMRCGTAKYHDIGAEMLLRGRACRWARYDPEQVYEWARECGDE